MRTIAVIPARGGSKRLEGKNCIELGGKPLIFWTLEAARDSKVFDQIVVSTEDQGIAELVDNWAGEKISLERPINLARDETPSLPVVKHVAANVLSDMIFLLQPTSPFRIAEDIQNVYLMLTQSQGDAVVSVTDGPCDLVFQIGHANRMRPRTDIVVANGGIYAIRTDALFNGEDWYSGVSYAYRMPKDRSLDIDTEADLMVARAMIQARKAA